MNQDSLDMVYHSESISRARSGETLKVKSIQLFTEDLKFKECLIERHLGSQFSIERYIYDNEIGSLIYLYENKNGQKERCDIGTSHNFHVQTPDAATTLMFAFARNVSQGSSINQKIYFVNNMWEYEGEPEHKTLIISRSHKGSQEEINVNGTKLRASSYTIFEDEDHEKSRKPGVTVYLSKHYGIPYQILIPDGPKIEVDFLNDRRENTPGLAD